MPSIKCTAADLVPGDVIHLTHLVHLKDKRGHYIKGPIRRMKGGKWIDDHGPISKPVRVVGRVVDLGACEDGYASIRFERTNSAQIPVGAVMPDVVDYVSLRSLDWKSTDLRRVTEHGPATRMAVAGKEFLRQSLIQAAGGGPQDEEAVERLAACVTAGAIETAEREGRLPYRMGIDQARKRLQGVMPYSEAAYRQLTGRSCTPEAIDAPKSDEPAGPLVVDPKAALKPMTGPHMIVLAEPGPADRQGEMIQAAYPGAVIRTVQLVNWRSSRPPLEDVTDEDEDESEDVDDTPEPVDAD